MPPFSQPAQSSGQSYQKRNVKIPKGKKDARTADSQRLGVSIFFLTGKNYPCSFLVFLNKMKYKDTPMLVFSNKMKVPL
jgi:hypothetical protein